MTEDRGHQCPCEEDEGASGVEEEVLVQWDPWVQWDQWGQWDQEDQGVLEDREGQGLEVQDLGVEVGQDFVLHLQDSEAHLRLGHGDQGLGPEAPPHPLTLTGDQCLPHHQAWEAPWVHQACPQWDQWVQWAQWVTLGHGGLWVHLGQVDHLTNNPTKINKTLLEVWI